MVVRHKPETFTVLECRCHSKDLLKNYVLARTLMKVMNNAEQTNEKGYFIEQNCFLPHYIK